MTETKQLLTAAETAGTYSIDPAHTNVGFRVRHMGLAIILGEFTDYTATISCDPNDVTKSSVQFTAIVASLDIKDSVGQTRLGGSAVLNINRLDYGIKWSQILDNGSLVVDNNVQIELQFEAVRQEETTILADTYPRMETAQVAEQRAADAQAAEQTRVGGNR